MTFLTGAAQLLPASLHTPNGRLDGREVLKADLKHNINQAKKIMTKKVKILKTKTVINMLFLCPQIPPTISKDSKDFSLRLDGMYGL